ncbi:VWA domain-containing protein [bacterium]|nr:VWA domain-containing protein [bacterium]
MRDESPKGGTWVYHADSITDDEDLEAGENEDGSRHAGDQNDPSGHDKKDDWDFAVRFRDIQRYGYLEPKERKEMSEKAILSVLQRARELLGPVQKPYRYLTMESQAAVAYEARGAATEIDIEESLMEGAPVLQVRLEKHHGLVLVLDTSLSMKGEKLALLAVTVAAACDSVPPDALCILGFDSEIHSIKEFGETIRTETAIERTLSIPAGGFTNIDLGLRTARMRMESSAHRSARVILVSDGRYTEGKNPVLEGTRIGSVFPVKIGKDPGGRTVMREISDSGFGRFAEIREMRDLPGFLLRAIREWVK